MEHKKLAFKDGKRLTLISATRSGQVGPFGPTSFFFPSFFLLGLDQFFTLILSSCDRYYSNFALLRVCSPKLMIFSLEMTHKS